MVSLVDFVALSLTPFDWRRAIGDRLRAGDAPSALIRAIAPDTPAAHRTLERLPGGARAALDRAEQCAMAVVVWSDADYPAMLAAIDDPPPVLWLRGDRSVLSTPAVAIVGARAASPYAVSVADALAADLAGRGLLVVSGLARGVDSAAHRGALRTGGRTLAVLGCGVDVTYPPEHRDLADTMRATEGCALISELAPGTKPLHWFFPLRNRIISGLSRGVVVIEAGEKSGSLITARLALEQGRDVMAVPGNVLGGRNRGGHALLRDGARIVESASDVVEELSSTLELGLASPRTGRPVRSTTPPDPVLAALPAGEALDLDHLAAETGLSPTRLLSRLLALELAGRVQRVGGGRFVRLDGSC